MVIKSYWRGDQSQRLLQYPAFSVTECNNEIVIQPCPTAASSRLQAHCTGMVVLYSHCETPVKQPVVVANLGWLFRKQHEKSQLIWRRSSPFMAISIIVIQFGFGFYCTVTISPLTSPSTEFAWKTDLLSCAFFVAVCFHIDPVWMYRKSNKS